MCFIRSCKGQSLVEFALLFGFVAFVLLGASGFKDAVAGLYPPGVEELRRIDDFKAYDVQVAVRDIESFQENGHYSVAATANQMHYKRGYIRSGWVDKFSDDASREEMVRLHDELGASQWTYLNNKGSVYFDVPTSKGYYRGDIGLYWTTDTLKSSMLTSFNTAESSNYSKELVLQYFYSSITGRYYVIKSHVWVNQGDVANHIALSGLHQTYKKPAGYFVDGCVDGFASVVEAKAVFEEARKDNGYSVIFSDGPSDGDLFAGDYLLVGDKFEHV